MEDNEEGEFNEDNLKNLISLKILNLNLLSIHFIKIENPTIFPYL